jgi:hypothetical protein
LRLSALAENIIPAWTLAKIATAHKIRIWADYGIFRSGLPDAGNGNIRTLIVPFFWKIVSCRGTKEKEQLRQRLVFSTGIW